MFTLANRSLPLLYTVCKALLLSLSALRPVGWERREWRRLCWMRMMTCGWLWDTNTLLRCQREWLWFSNHTWMDKQPKGKLLQSEQAHRLCHIALVLLWISLQWAFFAFIHRLILPERPVMTLTHSSAQGCDSFSERILCKQKDEHWRKGKWNTIWFCCPLRIFQVDVWMFSPQLSFTHSHRDCHS